MQKRLVEAARFIENNSPIKPRLGIVLGSGLGSYVDHVKNTVSIPYDQIPNFLAPSVEGHEGRLVLGTVTNPKSPNSPAVPVAILQGRLHLYEGHSMDQVAFPTRTLCMLGIDTLLLTNAAGGINPSFREADLMLINDHINLMGDNPLRGPNLKELGPRFPDLTEAYNKECQEVLRQAAARVNVTLREGVYVALSGPTYETPAEVRMLRAMGADAVGMSTVPETIAANHLGVRVAAISCITNLAAGITSQKLTHAEVMTNAGRAVTKLLSLLDEAIPALPHVQVQKSGDKP
ncbi:MAG: purine-nucleoside phosphorylase [Deltaproteobacteria bacterium]|nr:purine-nucleoside phosphorylase [Deltaproteobacteria bacterium]